MDTHRLRNLLDPALLRARSAHEASPRTTLSFYRYVRFSEMEGLRHELYAEWQQLGVLGRIYLAPEGINAQVSVPTANLERFRAALQTRPEFDALPARNSTTWLLGYAKSLVGKVEFSEVEQGMTRNRGLF